jgi:nicotinate phosphoribosyltransferase
LEASTHDFNCLDAQQEHNNKMVDNFANVPEGVSSLLDTDLYKLTMQCCILKFFPDVSVTYGFTNRTPEKKLNRAAFKWLQAQVASM